MDKLQIDTVQFLSTDIFAIITLGIIIFSSYRFAQSSKADKVFRKVLLMNAGVIVVDAIDRLLEKVPGTHITYIKWTADIFYFLFTGTVALMWCYYVFIYLYPEKNLTKTKLLLYNIPSLIFVICVMISPWCHTIFYVTPDNAYHRGDFFFMQFIIPYGYIALSFFLAIYRIHLENSKQKRQECMFLASFLILPFLASVIQLFIIDLVLMWSCTALSLLMVYVNMQNREVLIDGLTNINNRRGFDIFVANAFKNDSDKDIQLLILDIDEFKIINDEFGHAIGDKALINLAFILKKVCNKSDAYFARIGGDEFAVVLKGNQNISIDDIKSKINDEVAFANMQNNLPYILSVSIGTASTSLQTKSNSFMLFETADKEMYKNKNAKKQAKAFYKMG